MVVAKRLERVNMTVMYQGHLPALVFVVVMGEAGTAPDTAHPKFIWGKSRGSMTVSIPNRGSNSPSIARRSSGAEMLVGSQAAKLTDP